MYLTYEIFGHVASVDAVFDELVSLPGWHLSHGYIRHNRGPFLHRLIVQAGPSQIVDHIDGDPLNNTIENLRICSHAENMRNRKTHKNNKSGAKGVYRDKGKWRAQIRANGVKHILGVFETVEDAKLAYECAAKQLHGAFARHT